VVVSHHLPVIIVKFSSHAQQILVTTVDPVKILRTFLVIPVLVMEPHIPVQTAKLQSLAKIHRTHVKTVLAVQTLLTFQIIAVIAQLLTQRKIVILIFHALLRPVKTLERVQMQPISPNTAVFVLKLTPEMNVKHRSHVKLKVTHVSTVVFVLIQLTFLLILVNAQQITPVTIVKNSFPAHNHHVKTLDHVLTLLTF
jgi:hypothetical protein